MQIVPIRVWEANKSIHSHLNCTSYVSLGWPIAQVQYTITLQNSPGTEHNNITKQAKCRIYCTIQFKIYLSSLWLLHKTRNIQPSRKLIRHSDVNFLKWWTITLKFTKAVLWNQNGRQYPEIINKQIYKYLSSLISNITIGLWDNIQYSRKKRIIEHPNLPK